MTNEWDGILIALRKRDESRMRHGGIVHAIIGRRIHTGRTSHRVRSAIVGTRTGDKCDVVRVVLAGVYFGGASGCKTRVGLIGGYKVDRAQVLVHGI